MNVLGPVTRSWFQSSFESPTPVQQQGWRHVVAGEHTLLVAPTGSGKTLAAFLAGIDRLSRRPLDCPGVRLLYVSPLKALVYDIERNLRAPLVGLAKAADELGAEIHLPRVAMRTGDTPPTERRRLLEDPAEILVTTPESLYLLLGSQAREVLRTVDTVIVDEVHALAPTKRGAHLAVSLERLSALTERDPQRIGLSATAHPLADVARHLGGNRPVRVVDTSQTPRLDAQVIVPVPDMTRPQSPVDAAPDSSLLAEPHKRGIWPAIHPQLVDLIRSHDTTIVFVNSRGLCERLVHDLNELAGEALVRAHHGSLAHERRREVEEMLKSGELRGIIATSSLELGIDMGTVDLVVLMESPGSVTRGLQRIGRAGHQVDGISRGRIFPKHRADLLECAVVLRKMQDGELESIAVPRNPLDVLAQQIVAMCVVQPRSVADIEALVRRVDNYRDLPREALISLLDMLSGRYPSTEFADLRPHLDWDRDADRLHARRGAKMLTSLNAGTIPDRGLYGVHVGEGGPRIGELDEEMVHETIPGQTFTLGASTWRVEQVTRDRVLVSPAPGQPGKLPFWKGDGPGRSVALGRAIGEFLRKLDGMPRPRALQWLQDDHALDELAAENLLRYVAEQKQETGALPTDRTVVVERFRDELGDWRVCVLSPWGRRVHAPWALALQTRLARRGHPGAQLLWSDDGIVLRMEDTEALPELEALLIEPEEVEDLLVERLAHSSLFAARFRENAGRALLLPRRRARARSPLWAQRLKAQQLLSVARNYPSFPIVMETYRACMRDVFDLPALMDLLRSIRSRDIRVEVVETRAASPFASSLVFEYVASYLYEGDNPLAERKAQALSLDRRMLAALLGSDELRELLDPEVIDTVEAERQGIAEGFRAHHADALQDLLRRIGDLSEAELHRRCTRDPRRWLQRLRSSRSAAPVHIAGEDRWIATEDAGLYRDALGIAPPAGTPRAHLQLVPNAIGQLIRRWIRNHGPFIPSALGHRYGLAQHQVQPVLDALLANEQLVEGAFRAGGSERELCDPDMLRRIKRRTLAKLRNEVAPVDAQTLGRFIPAWHGVTPGPSRSLPDAIAQLEGLALPFSDWIHRVLPSRVEEFTPRALDDLGARGQVVWVGCGTLGTRDGKIALYRRERVALLLDPPTAPQELDPVANALLEHLTQRGACFFTEMASACPSASTVEIEQALWDLVWAGLITNDTFAPLHELGHAARHRRSRLATGGRWSRVADLLLHTPSETERAHGRTLAVLDRHGIVSRDIATLEQLEGGFSAIYPVLRAMEQAGRVRRGHFVEGLQGAQFALPGAVDRLRAARTVPSDPVVVLLAATDPASPYGWLLPWPETPGETGTMRRVAGAVVVLIDGALALYLDRGGRRLLTFLEGHGRERALAAVKALGAAAHGRRNKMLRVDSIDGQPARTATLAPLLREAAFAPDHQGLVLEAR